MKKTILSTLGAVTVFAVLMVSCGGASTPRTSLKNSVDSVSYAYGVSMADQGLMQYLEQNGVIANTSNIEYEYQMRIASADSTERDALEREMAAKIDSVNKTNGPKLNEFIKGLKDAINLEENSAYAQGLSIGTQFSQMMLPQVNSMLYDEEGTEQMNTDQLLAGLIAVLKNDQLAINTMEANTLVQTEIEKAQESQMAHQEEELKGQHTDAIEAGEAYLAGECRT